MLKSSVNIASFLQQTWCRKSTIFSIQVSSKSRQRRRWSLRKGSAKSVNKLRQCLAYTKCYHWRQSYTAGQMIMDIKPSARLTWVWTRGNAELRALAERTASCSPRSMDWSPWCKSSREKEEMNTGTGRLRRPRLCGSRGSANWNPVREQS